MRCWNGLTAAAKASRGVSSITVLKKSSPMRFFDCHSHFSTRAGLHHRTAEELANAERIFKRKRTFQTEQEMADGFRQRNVRSILDIYRTWRMTDEDEIRGSNDYATGFARDHRDV